MKELLEYIEKFIKEKSNRISTVSLLVLILLFASGCAHSDISNSQIIEEAVQQEDTKQVNPKKDTFISSEHREESNVEEIRDLSGKLKVHYINVGQGDSTLIELPNGKNVLIDGATRSNGQTVLDYLDNLRVEKIDYLIATHPHEDHIGGLINVVKQYEIGEIFMPKKAHTTIVFEDLLLAIKEKGYSITNPEVGAVLFDEDGLSMNVLAPSGASGNNLNNYSIANRLVFGNTAFVFTGDAEQQSEKNMVENECDLEADVLKIGHHGGDTSSISSFLSAVNPDYGIISAGKDNQYGHPHINVLNRLADHSIKVFRTDRDGTIIAKSDGDKIEFNQIDTPIIKTQNHSEKNNEGDEQVEVYRTDTGSKYHRGNCYTLKHSKVAIPLDEAKVERLEPCGICKPTK